MRDDRESNNDNNNRASGNKEGWRWESRILISAWTPFEELNSIGRGRYSISFPPPAYRETSRYCNSRDWHTAPWWFLRFSRRASRWNGDWSARRAIWWTQRRARAGWTLSGRDSVKRRGVLHSVGESGLRRCTWNNERSFASASSCDHPEKPWGSSLDGLAQRANASVENTYCRQDWPSEWEPERWAESRKWRIHFIRLIIHAKLRRFLAREWNGRSLSRALRGRSIGRAVGNNSNEAFTASTVPERTSHR